jgi:hypothetical protein
MKLPRIRLLKALRDRPASTPASASDDATAVNAAGEPVPVAAASMATQEAEPPLPRRQPKFPQVMVDRTPVDLAVLRKVLDALNEKLTLIRRQPSRSAAELPRAETAGLAIDEIASTHMAVIWHARKGRRDPRFPAPGDGGQFCGGAIRPSTGQPAAEIPRLISGQVQAGDHDAGAGHATQRGPAGQGHYPRGHDRWHQAAGSARPPAPGCG